MNKQKFVTIELRMLVTGPILFRSFQSKGDVTKGVC